MLSSQAKRDSQIKPPNFAGPHLSSNLHTLRNAWLCAFLVGAAILATYPVVELGVVDDWSYTKSALDFARTGHIFYNGWASAVLGWMIPWAALFIKLFGFSFTIVRLSMLPIAMASVFLFHQILLRFGITPRLAIFGTLALGLSPLFFPLTTTFMTDVPGLFVIFLCIYMCQRAVAAPTDRSALIWLCSAGLLNVAGGTVRQIAWLGALVMVPSTAWLLRRRHRMLLAGFVVWTVSIGAIVWIMHWFNQQPYTWSESAFVLEKPNLSLLSHLPILLVYALLFFAMILLPVLAAWIPSAKRLSSSAWVRIGIFMLLVAAFYIFLHVHTVSRVHGGLESNIIPWLPLDTVGSQGIVSIRFGFIHGSTIVTLGTPARVTISLIVIAVALIFAEREMAPPSLRQITQRDPATWRELFWILIPFAASYCVFLLPRSLGWWLFDRYLIPIMAVAIILLLKLYENQVGSHIPAISWTILALFALYTFAATHDKFVFYRARVSAADKVLSSGIPRTRISGGLEYDGWTEIENGGHINDPLILRPKGAYNSHVAPLPVAAECQYDNTMTPVVQPEYFLTYQPMHCLAASPFSPVQFRAWLPPFHRAVYIQQLPPSAGK